MSDMQSNPATNWLRFGVASTAPIADAAPSGGPAEVTGLAENVNFAPGNTVINGTQTTDVSFLLKIEAPSLPFPGQAVVQITTMPQPPNFSNIRVTVTGQWTGDRIVADRVRFVDSGFMFEKFKFPKIIVWIIFLFLMAMFGKVLSDFGV